MNEYMNEDTCQCPVCVYVHDHVFVSGIVSLCTRTCQGDMLVCEYRRTSDVGNPGRDAPTPSCRVSTLPLWGGPSAACLPWSLHKRDAAIG